MSVVNISYRYFSGGGGSGAASAIRANLNKLFDSYRDDVQGSPDTIGPDGCMKYFADLEVDLEDMDLVAASEVVQAPSMGEMTRQGFVDGWTPIK